MFSLSDCSKKDHYQQYRKTSQQIATSKFPTNTRKSPSYPPMLQLWTELPNELWLRIVDFSSTQSLMKISYIKPELFQIVTDYFEDKKLEDRTHQVFFPDIDVSVPYFKPVFQYGKAHQIKNVFGIRTNSSEIDVSKVLLFELYDTTNINEIWKNFSITDVRRVALMDTIEKVYQYAMDFRDIMIRYPMGCVFPATLSCTITSQLFGDWSYEQKKVMYPIFMSQAQDEVFPILTTYVLETFDGLGSAFENISLMNLKYLRINKTQISRFKNLWFPELENCDLSMTYNTKEEDLNYSIFLVQNIYVPKLKKLRLHRASTHEDYTFVHEAYWIPDLEDFFASSIDFYKDGSVDVFNDLDRILSMGIHERFLENLVPFLREDKRKLRKITLYDVKSISNNYNIWKHFENCPIQELDIGFCTQFCPKFYDNPNVQFTLLPTLTKLTISQMDSVNKNYLHHLSSDNNVKELEYTIRVGAREDMHVAFEAHLIDIAVKFPHLQKLTLNYYETESLVRDGICRNMIALTFHELEEFMVYSTHSINLNVFVNGSKFFKFPKLKKFFLLACGDYKNIYKQILEFRNLTVDDDFETMMNGEDDFDEPDITDYEEGEYVPTTGSSRTNSTQNHEEDVAVNLPVDVKQNDLKIEAINGMNHFLMNEGVCKSSALINYGLCSDYGEAYPSYEFQFDAPLLQKLSVFSMYDARLDTIIVDKYPLLKSLNLLRSFDGVHGINIRKLVLHKDNEDSVSINQFNRLSTSIEETIYR